MPFTMPCMKLVMHNEMYLNASGRRAGLSLERLNPEHPTPLDAQCMHATPHFFTLKICINQERV